MNAVLKPVAKAVAEIYHARLGASGASGWMNCPAWQGGGAASIHAATGSVIHEVSADCITADWKASERVGETFTSDGFEVEFNADHAAIAQTYIDYCQSMMDVYKGGDYLVETSLPIDHITGEPNAISTIDFGIIPPPGMTEALVVDLKTGAGVAVDAIGNPQGALYAIAMVDQYSLVAEIKTVRIVIVQPPLNYIGEWVVTVEELEVWREKFQAAASLAMSENPVAVPGEKQCRWCQKKATCKALAADMFNDLDQLPPEVLKEGEATTDELAYAMGKVETMESWCKAVRAETEKRLLDGRKVAGWKLVQGKRGNRQWSNATDAEALLKAMRLKTEEMYSLSLISPTTADKLSKAGTIGPKQWVKVQALITQKDGSPSVAPESDKRDALDLATTFTNLDQEVPH